MKKLIVIPLLFLTILPSIAFGLPNSGSAVGKNEQNIGRRIAVLISVVDNWAIEDKQIEKNAHDLETAGYTVLRATVNISRLYLYTSGTKAKKRARESLLAQIRNLPFKPGDQMKLLVVSTHGGSDEATTKLNLLGDVSGTGLDERAQEVFKPLVPYAADDLRVVLLSCSTFCGKPENTKLRARSFLNFFHVKHGSLFGARTHMMLPSYRNLPSPFLIKIGAVFYMFVFNINFVSDLIQRVQFSSPAAALSNFFLFPASTVVLATFLWLLGRNSITNLLTAGKLVNQGHLFTTGDGTEVQMSPVSVIENKKQLLGIEAPSCSGAFSSHVH